MKRFSRGEKWMLGASGALMLGLGAVGAVRMRLEDEPAWNIPAPAPTPKPNGFDLYAATMKAVVRANPPIDAANDGAPPATPAAKAQRYSLARREAWAKANAPAWALFEQARRAESRHPTARDVAAMRFKSYAGMRELARCKVALANTTKMRGDWIEAARHGLDAIEMSGDIARGGPLISFLVSVAIQAIGEDTFRDTPARLDATSARAAAKRLEEIIAARPTFAEVMVEEKWVGLEHLRGILNDLKHDWRNARGWNKNASMSEVVKTRLLSRRAVVDNYIRAADAAIRRARNSYQRVPAPLPVPGNVVNDLVNPQPLRSRFNAARADLQLSFLLLRLTLRAHRVESGAYPARLSDLAPKCIAAVPGDPFNRNLPFGYRKTGDSYLLWSVGPDGVNNNGQPIPPRGKRQIAQVEDDSIGDAIALPESNYSGGRDWRAGLAPSSKGGLTSPGREQ